MTSAPTLSPEVVPTRELEEESAPEMPALPLPHVTAPAFCAAVE
ncbi:MAG: hypothetical protein BWY09_01042 [Candidatus Hydrogenedentes bacterium ADurb.Bin179]|nr:MAG: hypothetical protein BWY09_01042 [Candidatus Hydrogenedentes bacterium ADurb.Bin179]